MNNKRMIVQNKAVPLCKKFFSKNFCRVCDNLVSADKDNIKILMKKDVLVHRETKM